MPSPFQAQPPESSPAGAIRRITHGLLWVQGVAILLISALLIGVADWSAGAALSASLLTVLLVRMLIIGNNFVLAWVYRSPRRPEHRLGLLQSIRLFLVEYACSMLSSSWSMAFKVFERRLVPDSPYPLVLLLHGYGANSGYWSSMSHALMRERISHYALDLEPPLASMDELADQVAQAIQTIQSEQAAPVRLVLLAHSMGGLVARAYLRKYGAAAVSKVITIGTPHHGTALANFGIGENSVQMRWQGRESAWLHALGNSENETLRGLFVSIYSPHDNIVAPQNSSVLPGARNLAFPGIGHVALGMSRVVQQTVIREIISTE